MSKGNYMVFNRKYYKKYLSDIKQKVGARYTPELNVKLPISEIFDGISRTENFFATIREKYGELFREFRYVTSKYDNELQKNYDKIEKDIKSLFKILERIREYNTSHIPWDIIQEQTKVLEDKLWKFTDQLRKERVSNFGFTYKMVRVPDLSKTKA